MDGVQWTRSGIVPGEVRLIEQSLGAPLSSSLCDLLTDANVILYDRRLAALVSELLPLGSYAEPLSSRSVADGPAQSPRAQAFARDGWKVLVLVAPPADRPVIVDGPEPARRFTRGERVTIIAVAVP